MKKEEQEFPFRVFGVYSRLLLGHPIRFAFFLLFYLVIFLTVIVDVNFIDVVQAPFEAPALRRRIGSLEVTLAEKDAVISRLGQGRDSAPLFRDFTFDEAWISEEARVSVNRLLEYAEFAISKDDSRHAQRLYEEANQVQETIAVHYYQGRLAYIQGDLKRTANSWMAATTLDTDRKYPILRLYLGIVLYERGEEARANQLIKEYAEGL